MFLAPQIIRKVVVNYSNRHDLPTFAITVPYDDLPERQTNVERDLQCPVTEYHQWLTQGASEFERDRIIESIQSGKTSFTASSVVEEKKPAKKAAKNKATHLAVKFRRNTEEKKAEFNDMEDDDDDIPIIDEENNENKELDEALARSNARTSMFNNVPQHIVITTTGSRVAPPTMPSASLPTVATSEQKKRDELFTMLTTLHWRDRDEQVMSVSSLNRVDLMKLRGLVGTMKKMADELRQSIQSSTGALDDMDEEEVYNFLFHIIAKGEQFYLMACTESDMCMYLLGDTPPQYQPLYTFIKKKLKLSNL